MKTAQICPACRVGNHQHDRNTRTGADGGCPNQATPGDLYSECQCAVVVATQPPSRCPCCGRPR